MLSSLSSAESAWLGDLPELLPETRSFKRRNSAQAASQTDDEAVCPGLVRLPTLSTNYVLLNAFFLFLLGGGGHEAPGYCGASGFKRSHADAVKRFRLNALFFFFLSAFLALPGAGELKRPCCLIFWG